MLQVRFHGRGGQGVVTAADMLATAAFIDGYYAQSFPSFGSERMGAPVVAYCRIDDQEIRTREPVAEPNVILIQDATLLHQSDVLLGLAKESYALVNTTKSPVELESVFTEIDRSRIFAIPATDLALRHVKRAVPNVPLLGALCAVADAISLRSLEAAIKERFANEVAEGNVSAAREAYRLVKESFVGRFGGPGEGGGVA